MNFVETYNRIEILFKWATENNLLEDPKRISKLYDEARRRWGHLMTRYRISEIVEGTLRKMTCSPRKGERGRYL